METDRSKNNKLSIAHYAALKTAIANGEASLLETLLLEQTMLEIEKSYLIDLAKLSSDPTILSLVEAIAIRE